MEEWLRKYGKFFNYSALEIALGIPGGTLREAEMNDRRIPEEWKIKTEHFFNKMQSELMEKKDEGNW